MKRVIATASLTALLAVSGWAQSAPELLQKGIFTEDTAGDLDGAIQIFRQIVGSSPTQRDVAAEAQYRLAQALIRKGDLTGAAIEYQRLARDFSEQQALISRLAAALPQLHVATPAPNTAEFDSSKPVTVTGTVQQVLWMNPRSWITVKDGSGTDWRISAGSPNQLISQQFTKDTLKLTDQVTVNGILAKDGTKTASAETIFSSTGKMLFDRSKVVSQESVPLTVTATLPDGTSFPLTKTVTLRASLGSPEDYDPNASVAFNGIVVETKMLNPTASIIVDSLDGSGRRYTFALVAPQNLSRMWSNGIAPKAGDKIIVRGYLSKDAHPSDGTVHAMAETILSITTTPDGRPQTNRMFDRTYQPPKP